MDLESEGTWTKIRACMTSSADVNILIGSSAYKQNHCQIISRECLTIIYFYYLDLH